MLSISQQQAGQRWEIITPQLREALFSDVNADLVWNLCQTEHLSEEKSYQVAEYAGYVLFGFIRPEEFSEELVESLEIPSPSAKTISAAINEKIFTPLRADIDKIYTSAADGKTSTSNPQIIQGVGTIASPATTPVPMPKPIDLSSVGWSKTRPVGSSSQATTTPSPAPQRATPPQAPKPVPTVPIPAPTPVMLRQETPSSAAQKNADFHIAKSGENAQMEFSTAKEQAKVRPAVIEFNKGASSTAKPATPVPAPLAERTGSPRYTEFKSSLAASPVANSGRRMVTEITSPTSAAPIPVPPKPQTPPTPAPAQSAIPKPIAPPLPPMPPMPPAPSASPATSPTKVIVQNFPQQPK